MYYDPYQLAMMQQYRGNPAVLAMLRQQFSRVQPVDEAKINSEANAKSSEFLSGQVAPELARVVAGDQGTGSFGAARQAFMMQEGARRAQDVQAAARSAAMEREMALRRMQMDEEERAWGGLDFGGAQETQNQVARAQESRGNLDRYIEGGAAALNGIGRMYAQGQMNNSFNPLNRFASALGSVFKTAGNIGRQAVAPITNQYRRTPIQSRPTFSNPRPGGFSSLIPEDNDAFNSVGSF